MTSLYTVTSLFCRHTSQISTWRIMIIRKGVNSTTSGLLSRRSKSSSNLRCHSSSSYVKDKKVIQIINVQKSTSNNNNFSIRENRWKSFTERVLDDVGAKPTPVVTAPTIQEAFNSIQFWLSAAKQERAVGASKASAMSMVESVKKADQLLRVLMTTTSKAVENNFISEKLLKVVTLSVLDNWRLIAWQTSSTTDTKIKAAESAGKLLTFVEQDDRIQSIPVKYYNTVLDAYAKAGQIKRVEALLQRMISSQKQSYNVTASRVTAPDTVSYNTCIGAWAQAGKFLSSELHPLKRQRYLLKAAQASEKWLRKMEADPSDNVIPGTITYTAVMNAWSHAAAASTATRKKSKATPQYVEHLFEEMCHAYKTGKNPHVKPNATTYGTVISAWAHSPKIREAPERAEALLRQMEDLYKQSSDDDLKPEIMYYNMVLHLFSNSGRPDAGRSAERLLLQLEKRWSNEEPFAVEPDVNSYNTVLNSYAKSKEPGSAQRAERLLEEMIFKYEAQGRTRLKPDTISFTTVIDALSKDNKNRQQQARKAEALLWRMLSVGDPSMRPNVKTFTAVIDAYARDATLESSERAESLLKSMQQSTYVEPNIFTYNAVLNSYAKCGLAEKAEELLNHIMLETALRVDKRSFNACIEAWAAKKLPISADRAEALLSQMHDLYGQGGYDEVQPDLITYNTALRAICDSGAVHCGDRAEALWNQMVNSPLSGATKPDTLTYNIVIMAWSHSCTFDSPENAESLLRLMCQKYQSKTGPKPDVISFNTAIYCWAKSKRPDKTKRTIQLFEEMKDPSSLLGRLAVKPDLITYNTVLNAFATASPIGSTEEKTKILSCLKKILDDLEDSKEVNPDSFFFSALLKACCSSNIDTGNLASRIFEKCCSAGYASQRILKYFKLSDLESYNKIIGNRTIDDLPKHWFCNAQR